MPWPRFAVGFATHASAGTIEAMPMWGAELVGGVLLVELRRTRRLRG
jgi:hypothetical protein